MNVIRHTRDNANDDEAPPFRRGKAWLEPVNQVFRVAYLEGRTSRRRWPKMRNRVARGVISSGKEKGTQMSSEAMLRTLEEHHQTIMAGLSEVRRQCGKENPSSRELAEVRERLTSASLARSRFVSEEVVPSLLKNADDDLRTELSELLFATATKRMFSKAHIAQWTSASIEADWSGYCAAARGIWPMMEEQIARETRVLSARLRK
jgi:hypothetical protein